MEPGSSVLTEIDRIEPPKGPLEVAQTPSEIEVVKKAMAGDRPAFDELILQYQRQAVAVAYRLLGNTQDSLEVTQDAFLKAFKSLPTLQKPEAFGGWFLRIVSNLSLNYRRSRKHRKQLPLDDLLGAGETGGSEWAARLADPSRQMESGELGAKLQEALMQLPEKQRQALLMFTVDELPQKDVAVALNCSVEAVKWHVFQGRKKLREILKDQLQD